MVEIGVAVQRHLHNWFSFLTSCWGYCPILLKGIISWAKVLGVMVILVNSSYFMWQLIVCITDQGDALLLYDRSLALHLKGPANTGFPCQCVTCWIPCQPPSTRYNYLSFRIALVVLLQWSVAEYSLSRPDSFVVLLRTGCSEKKRHGLHISSSSWAGKHNHH